MREYDLIVFGATGYTGRLVAEALLEFPEPGLRWAIAGRSREKLESVQAALTARFPEAESLEMVVADVSDAEFRPDATTWLASALGPWTRVWRRP